MTQASENPVQAPIRRPRRNRKPVVLIVDDAAGFARRLGMAFEEEGYLPRTAFDGEEALREAAEQPPDLIVMDVRMPRMDGIACLATLRETYPGPRPPVILISGDPSPYVDLAGQVFEGTHVLRKPCTYDEIIEKGKEVLETA